MAFEIWLEKKNQCCCQYENRDIKADDHLFKVRAFRREMAFFVCVKGGGSDGWESLGLCLCPPTGECSLFIAGLRLHDSIKYPLSIKNLGRDLLIFMFFWRKFAFPWLRGGMREQKKNYRFMKVSSTWHIYTIHQRQNSLSRDRELEGGGIRWWYGRWGA